MITSNISIPFCLINTLYELLNDIHTIIARLKELNMDNSCLYVFVNDGIDLIDILNNIPSIDGIKQVNINFIAKEDGSTLNDDTDVFVVYQSNR